MPTRSRRRPLPAEHVSLSCQALGLNCCRRARTDMNVLRDTVRFSKVFGTNDLNYLALRAPTICLRQHEPSTLSWAALRFC